MTQQEFIDLLKSRKYEFEITDGKVDVRHQGSVYLESLTTLPEGVEFNNQGFVYLRSLTTLPEGVEFNNQGYVDLESLTTLPEGVEFNNQGFVYLRSLTTLPEGVEFNNQGFVYLRSLTTLPEGVEFNNQGSVDLESLTTLPEGVEFNNQGSVDLRSLTGWHFYMGETRRFETIDGSTMIITSTKQKSGVTLHKAKYFAGGKVEELKSCFLAEIDGVWAHGNTASDAIRDANFKTQKRAGKKDAIARVLKTKTVTANDFHIITGACFEGMRHHLSQRGISMEEVDSLPLESALTAMSGSSYGDQFSCDLESAQ